MVPGDPVQLPKASGPKNIDQATFSDLVPHTETCSYCRTVDPARSCCMGHVASYYAASTPPLQFESLEGGHSADVCIVGAGYTGLSTALHLAKRGYAVVVLEAEKVGWGASGRNGGHVGIGQRQGQDYLERKLGRDKAQQLWALGLEAVELVKRLIADHDINCDLKQGILHVASKPRDAEYLRASSQRLSSEYGYTEAGYVEQDEVNQILGSRQYYGGQLESEAVHLHPLKYAQGLARAAMRAGARIFEHSRAINYQHGPPASVTTAQGTVSCKTVVLACNGYLDKFEPAMAAKIMPINNFVLATEPLNDALARELIRDDVAVQDSLYVINYWRLSADNRLIFGGGENYSRRFPRDIKAFVRKYMLRIYPQLVDTRIDYAWGGTLAISLNRLPQFGRLAPNVLYAQGYSGHGVSTSTLAGQLLAEAIEGTTERFDLMASLPSPTFPGGTLLRWPGLVAGMSYYALRDRL